MTTTIYGLVCPISGLLRYIGKTAKPPQVRYRKHVATARRGCVSHKAKWIRWLLRRGKSPGLVLIEECGGDGAAEEVFHIALARADGLNLTNETEGGDGHELTPEAKAKIGAKSRGRKPSEEALRKMSAAKKGKPSHPNTVAAVREAAMRQEWSPERVARREAAMAARGVKNSTGYKGVRRISRSKLFGAGIMIRGQHINLGNFPTAEAAARAYDAALVRRDGEYARPNFPGDSQPLTQLKLASRG